MGVWVTVGDAVGAGVRVGRGLVVAVALGVTVGGRKADVGVEIRNTVGTSATSWDSEDWRAGATYLSTAKTEPPAMRKKRATRR